MAYFLRLLNLHCICPNNGDVDDVSLTVNEKIKKIGKMTYDDKYSFKTLSLLAIQKDISIKLWTKEWLKSKFELGRMLVPKLESRKKEKEFWFDNEKKQYLLNYNIGLSYGKPVLILIDLYSSESSGAMLWDKISLHINDKAAINSRKLRKGKTLILKKVYPIYTLNNIKISLFRQNLMHKELLGNHIIKPKYKSLGVRDKIFDNDGSLYKLKYDILQFLV